MSRIGQEPAGENSRFKLNMSIGLEKYRTPDGMNECGKGE